jgi:oligopeptide/dipeptide ABC transporter ATP-binding protein
MHFKERDKMLLNIRNLKTYYFTDEGVVKAVDGIDLKIKSGETLGLVGETGCGKSTVATSIMRLVSKPGKIVAGEIIFKGRNLLELSNDEMRKIRGSEMAMIFQDPMVSLNPVIRVGEQIAEVFRVHRGMKRSEAWEKAVEIMKLVGIPEAERMSKGYPHELSGGMRQRIIIAIALACRPSLLIADEPTSALDVTIQAQILSELKRLREEVNTSMLLITHDLGVIAEMADKVAIMYAGDMVEYGDVRTVLRKPKHPYTRGLLNALPNAHRRSKLANIRGAVPSLLNPPSGCKFHPRCSEAKNLCSKVKPQPVEVAPEHLVSCLLYGSDNLERAN